MSQFSKMSGYKINSGKTEIWTLGQKQIHPEVFKQFKVHEIKLNI